jgi:murein DD-endopeptidase MepM/ murein hydrolase activator NlpD
MLAASVMLGGLLPLDAHTREQWPPSGAWRLPVGDAYAIASEPPKTVGSFFVLRSVEWDGLRASHQGADLSCGKGGQPVHAAAAGLVLEALDRGEYGGYGTHVVLAHRLPGGVLAYTVYAHLRIASLRVHAGQRVQAGQVLGRVGMTGHATGPHLHFELRSADDPEEPWELGRVEDPLAFVEERLPSHRADTTGAEGVLEWGEFAALLPLGAHSDDALTREAWWRMLAAAVKGPPLDPALDASALRDSLIMHRILPRDATSGYTAVAATWPEVARDLARARRMGVRSGTGPLRSAQQREVCAAVLGTPTPALHTALLSGRDGRPTLAQAVVMLSDVAGPRPEPPPPPAPVARPVHKRMGPFLTPADSLHADSLRVAAAARARAARAARARAERARADSARADSARGDSLGDQP